MCFHKSTVFGMFNFDCHLQHASHAPNPARKIVPRQIQPRTQPELFALLGGRPAGLVQRGPATAELVFLNFPAR
jgi:hypothetical protein